MRYRATFSTHMNFYPGTMTRTPPEYRYTLAAGARQTREQAESDVFAARSMMDHPEDWTFEIQEIE